MANPPTPNNMRPLSDQEKRTIRIAAVAIGVYLILFYGYQGWKRLESGRLGYVNLLKAANAQKQDIDRYQQRLALAEKFRAKNPINFDKLSRSSLVADVSAAIQAAARTGGVQVGPIRESPVRASANELASMQLEATAPVPAVMNFLHRLDGLGYPLIVESVQLAPGGQQPGALKLTLTLVVLNFEEWKSS